MTRLHPLWFQTPLRSFPSNSAISDTVPVCVYVKLLSGVSYLVPCYSLYILPVQCRSLSVIVYLQCVVLTIFCVYNKIIKDCSIPYLCVLLTTPDRYTYMQRHKFLLSSFKPRNLNVAILSKHPVFYAEFS